MKKILLKLLKPLVVELVKEEMEKQTLSVAKDVMKLVGQDCKCVSSSQELTQQLEGMILRVLESASLAPQDNLGA